MYGGSRLDVVKEYVVLAGNPVAVKVTFRGVPLSKVTPTCKVADPPCGMDTVLPPMTWSPKSNGAGGGV